MLEGKTPEALLAELNSTSAARLNSMAEIKGRVRSGMRVIIDKEHMIHLDNSGHLTGVPARKNRRNDPNPLTALDFKNIPAILHSPDLAKYAGMGHFGQKIKLEKTLTNKQRIILELVEHDSRLIVASFYNINKKKLP